MQTLTLSSAVFAFRRAKSISRSPSPFAVYAASISCMDGAVRCESVQNTNGLQLAGGIMHTCSSTRRDEATSASGSRSRLRGYVQGESA